MSGHGLTFEMFETARRAPPASAERPTPPAPREDASSSGDRARGPLLDAFGRIPPRAAEIDPPAARRRPAAAPDDAHRQARETDDRRVARLRGRARAQGYAEGVAASEAETQAELRLIAADLREGLAEALHSLVEREEAMAGRMQELAEALLSAAAPAFARAGLASEVAEAVGAALREAGDGLAGPAGDDALTVRVSPEQAERTRLALASAGLSAPVAADPRLGPLRAELDWGGGADRIDLGAALAAAQAALERHLHAQERTAAHG
ncbi:MAG: hypothetical protein AAF763_04660 [Pseudomonadota bacterium]